MAAIAGLQKQHFNGASVATASKVRIIVISSTKN
jgi:hypothetical protein